MSFNIEKQFSYGYLPGSHLLQTLTMPCNMTLTQSYESQRDLLIGMAYHRGNTLVTQRSYSYDSLGRPLTRAAHPALWFITWDPAQPIQWSSEYNDAELALVYYNYVL